MGEIRATNFLTIIFILAIILTDSATGFSFVDFCGKTTRRDLCVNTISQDPRANLKNDPLGMCVILNDKAKPLAASTYQKIKDALGGGTDPALHACLNAYDEIVQILDLLDFYNREFGFLNLSLLYAYKAATRCLGFGDDVQDLEDLIVVTQDVLNLNHCNMPLC